MWGNIASEKKKESGCLFFLHETVYREPQPRREVDHFIEQHVIPEKEKKSGRKREVGMKGLCQGNRIWGNINKKSKIQNVGFEN